MLFLRFLFFQLISVSSSSEQLDRQRTSISASQRNERVKRLFAVKFSKSAANNKASVDIGDRNLASSKDKDRQASSQNTTEDIQQRLSEISRILSKKADDYYGILGVSRYASEDSIIQQYRKLSLLVHPDKIKAPGALEATQRVNKARDELMKPFHNRDQKNYYRSVTTAAFTVRRSTSNNADEEHKSSADDKWTENFASSTFEAQRQRRPPKKKTYIIVGFCLSLVGIVLLMVYWRHQSQQRSLRNRRHTSENSRIPAAGSSPDLDDANFIENAINDETSMVQNGHSPKMF